MDFALGCRLHQTEAATGPREIVICFQRNAMQHKQITLPNSIPILGRKQNSIQFSSIGFIAVLPDGCYVCLLTKPIILFRHLNDQMENRDSFGHWRRQVLRQTTVVELGEIGCNVLMPDAKRCVSRRLITLNSEQFLCETCT